MVRGMMRTVGFVVLAGLLALGLLAAWLLGEVEPT